MPSPPVELLNRMVIPPLDPNAYSFSPFGAVSPTTTVQQSSQIENRFPDQFPDSYFTTYDQAHEWEPPLASGVSEDHSEIDWSQYGLDSNNNYGAQKNGAASSQPPSYASFDHYSHLSHPGLTSSSGEISEVEDFVSVNKPDTLRGNSHDALDDFNSIGGDDTNAMDSYRLSSASSYIGMPQANMLANGNLEGLDIDDYLKQAEIQTRELALQNQRLQQQQQQQRPADLDFSKSGKAVVGEHPFTIQEAQTYAHMNDNTPMNLANTSPVPVINYENDPMWSYTGPDTPSSMIDVDDRDESWVR